MKQIAQKIRDNISGRRWRDWRWQLANRLADVSQITAFLNLPPGQRAALGEVAEYYPFCVTPYYFSLCNPYDVRDPIRRQFMPDRRELLDGNTLCDPLNEEKYSPVPGLIHRYRNRVVVIVTTDCAVRCRHCTRKNTLSSFVCPASGQLEKVWQGVSACPQCYAQRCRRAEPSDGERLTQRVRPTYGGRCPVGAHYLIAHRLPAILKYIRRYPQVREVLVSGGDPLLLETPALDKIMGELTAIKHVEVLRIGTRAPVVLPMRIDAELCACLAEHRPLWINTQFNHPREITRDAVQACRQLQEAGLPVSNQTVLLRGINDSAVVLAKLFNELQRIMVRPYYVFQCDPVRGVKHFMTPLSAGAKLSRRLRDELGGLSMPLFVADLPGRKSKVPL